MSEFKNFAAYIASKRDGDPLPEWQSFQMLLAFLESDTVEIDPREMKVSFRDKLAQEAWEVWQWGWNNPIEANNQLGEGAE